nr:TonB-dependent receptor [uncultured Duganella sp.]
MTHHRFHAAAAARPLLLSLLVMSVASAWGQSAGGDATDDTAAPMQTVEVSGKALAVQKAIADKRDKSVISDGISSDEIGSIPDFGLGEALERVPGVSMIPNNGRGEAQFMTLRGLNPDYNTVTLDGVALPGTETTRRTVSLDVIPASLAKRVSVYKSFTPEMEGNAIGGITDLTTRSALDRGGFHASGRADYTSWDKPKLRGDSPSGQLEGTVSNTFGERQQFGALLSAGYYRRVSSSLNTAVDSYSYFRDATSQTNGAKVNQAGNAVNGLVAMPDRIRWLSYDNIRERRNIFGKFDYDNDSNFRAHLSGGIFQHINDEDRRAQWLQNTNTATSAVAQTGPRAGSVASGQSQTDYAKFDQKREMKYVELGGQYQPSALRAIDFTLNDARGSYRQDAKLYTFASANSAALAYKYDYDTGEVPVFTPVGTGAFGNAALFNQTENTTQRETSDNRTRTFKLSMAHNMAEGSKGWGYKGGAQLRKLTQEYDFNELKYVPAAGATISLSAVGAGTQSITPYNSGGLGLLLVDPQAAQRYFDANQGRYALAATNTQNSTQRDFGIGEHVGAAYAMAAYRAAQWSALFGLRYESTSLDVHTFTPSPANQSSVYAPVFVHKSYGNALPSANLAYDIGDALKLRTAASLSIGRPTYAALGQNSTSVTGTTIAQTLANPNLEPRKSANYDLSLEWYPMPRAMISAGLFHKEISQEIASLTSTQNLTIGNVVYQNQIAQAQNVGDASLTGVELGLVNTRFTQLPAPFNNFGASVNYTRLLMRPSSIVMADRSAREMPSLMESPKSMLNASLLWGSGPFSGQLSYNWTDRTLISLSSTNAAQDVYYKANGYVDAQFKYMPSKQVSFVFQGKNLGNTRRVRVTGTDQQLLNQEINNGRGFYAGVTMAY